MSATVVAVMLMKVSLRLMERVFGSTTLITTLVNEGQAQELRADLQVSLLGGLHVDLETDLVISCYKGDDAAGVTETIDIRNRDGGGRIQPAKNARETPLFGDADEDELKMAHVVAPVDPFGDDGMGSDQFPLDRFVEVAAKRIGPDHADHERARAAGECRLWPVDELREIHQKRRLQRVFGRPLRRRPRQTGHGVEQT